MQIGGSVAVVTGGASGIGHATALALAAAGADVVVADIDASGAQAVAEQVGGLAIDADLSQREEVERVVRESIAWKGRVDLFVSNAGIGCEGNAQDFTVDQWESLIALDLMASVWAMRLFVPHMLERGAGHLAFVASGAGYEAFADRAPYNVAKFGLVALAEALARQLKGSGVGVSVIVPGAVSTGGWRSYVFAGEAEPSAAQREALREHVRYWPSAESMAAVIVEGIRKDRFHIVQPYDAEPTWFTDIFRRRAEDPDAFVLGS
jgi:NAD(P)-dependent dehydrogenase (short-subunit alcohol dehydrogenase family)